MPLHRQGRPGAAPGHRRRDDGLPSAPSRPPTATSTPPSSGCGRRGWRRRQAPSGRTPRGGRRCSSTTGAPPSCSSSARPTSSPRPSTSGSWPRTSPPPWPRTAPTPSSQRAKELDDLRITLKENIEVGDVVRFEAGRRRRPRAYLHVQGGRGVNGVLVELDGGSHELAHDVAVHIAFARPRYLAPSDVPADEVDRERATLETITRNEGKPEQALAEDRRGPAAGLLQGRCACSSSPSSRTRSRPIAHLLGGAEVVRFAQVEIG